MDGVVDPKFAVAMGKLGGLAVLNLEGIYTRYDDYKSILEEIASVRNPMIYFVDDNIIGYNSKAEEHAVALFEGMIRRKLKKDWFAQASLNIATIAQLREAGTEYPEWVEEAYLQGGEALTNRTKRLAEQITAGLETPYDKAAAITDYLRKNITYVETIDETPPAGQDLIDWFLFDIEKGFCNYYSTAEIMMLRYLGIPARWAAGYAQGELLSVSDEAAQQTAEAQQSEYLVRQRDAHAWPEVYFPGLGWVEFEPTAIQPEITRPVGVAGSNASSDPSQNDSLEEQQRREMEEELAALREDRQRSASGEALPGQRQVNVVYWIVALVLGGMLLFLAWRYRHRLSLQAAPLFLEDAFLKAGLRPPKAIQRWARHAALPPLTKAYVQINYALSRLGRRPAATETPSERAASLSQIVPLATTPAQLLVGEYQIGIFSQGAADLELASKAAGQIRSLSIQEMLRSWLARLQRPSQPRRPNQ
jgi:transglutaminase-like putative cysteine protease